VQRLKKIGLIVFIALTMLCCAGCTSNHEEFSGPIHMDISEDLGLSGFIFGTFVLLHAYIVIIISCVILILKDRGIEKLVNISHAVLGMINIPEKIKVHITNLLNKLNNEDVRIQVGSVGLLIGITLAYLSAWIAL
jgi:hypothetical protein